MALVVLLRGVNVGGHRIFRPAALATELACLDAVSYTHLTLPTIYSV